MTTVITGTQWTNKAQLQLIQDHFNNELYTTVQIGVYSSTNDIGLSVTDKDGNIHNCSITPNAQFVDQYAHLK